MDGHSLNRRVSNENVYAQNDFRLVYVVILPVLWPWNVRCCPWHNSTLAGPRLRGSKFYWTVEQTFPVNSLPLGRLLSF